MPTDRNLGNLHARIAETEPGLFKATYVEETTDGEVHPAAIPDSHIGTSSEGVRMWVEEMAASMGYSGVIWE